LPSRCRQLSPAHSVARRPGPQGRQRPEDRTRRGSDSVPISGLPMSLSVLSAWEDYGTTQVTPADLLNRLSASDRD